MKQRRRKALNRPQAISGGLNGTIGIVVPKTPKTAHRAAQRRAREKIRTPTPPNCGPPRNHPRQDPPPNIPWQSGSQSVASGPPPHHCQQQYAGLPATTANSPAAAPTAQQPAPWSWQCARSTTRRRGRKACHWPDNADKRTYGAGPFYGLLWRGRLRIAACDLHICEGLADGLRILRYATGPALVAVCAGTSYARIQPGYFNATTLWPDADEAGARAASKAAQRWADQGHSVTIKWLPAGRDPASAPLQEPEHE